MKVKHFFGTMLLIMMCSMTFVACGSDNDEEGGSNSLVGGRWIELENTREVISNWAELWPEWFESKESLSSNVSWKFIDDHTVVKFYAELYAYKRNDAFYSEKIAGHQIYFVEGDGDTYTYVIKDGLIYITNGTILNWGDGYLLDNGVTWVKK